MDDLRQLSKLMQWRLSILKVYVDDKNLTESTRQRELASQVREILDELDNEPLTARPSVITYLRHLGLGNLI